MKNNNSDFFRAKLEDVAAACGVTKMTVSRALRGVEGVSEKKRLKILEMAKKLNYVPDNSARTLAMTNSNLIGISIPTLYNDVFAELIDAMRETFRRAGYSTVIETTNYDKQNELEWVQRLISWRPAAIVLTGQEHLDETVDALRTQRIPTLEVWDAAKAPIDLAVGIDHYDAGFRLGRYVASLGYRRPAYVGAEQGFDPRAEARLRGLKQAFRDVGRVQDWTEIRTGYRSDPSAGGLGLHDAKAQAPDCDLVVFLNDHYALGGLMACHELGIRVPEDLGVVGFNGVPFSQSLKPLLTTMTSRRHDIGQIGAKKLLARLNGVSVRGAEILVGKVIEGTSTRPQ